VNGAHVSAHGEVTQRDAREHGNCTVPFTTRRHLKHGMETEQAVAAAEELVQQVELGDDVQQVEYLGGSIEDDQVVASSIAADETNRQTGRSTGSHTLLTRVATCSSNSNNECTVAPQNNDAEN